MASIAGPLIGLGTSLFSGLFGSHAAKQAGQVESDASQSAQRLIQQQTERALGLESGMWNTTQANQAPFLNAGQDAITTLSSLMKSGSLTPAAFQSPTAATEQNDPGYQFRLNQGLDALNNSAAAKGGLLSGGTLKASQQYAQDYASNEFGNVYNRAVNDYQLGINNQNNTFNRYAQLGQFGANSAAQLGQVGANITGQEANILGNGTAGQAQQINNAAQAQAAGIVGSSNALTGGITGAGGNLSDLLAALTKSRGSSYSPTSPTGINV